MNLTHLRTHFPFRTKKTDGSSLIYLDSAATSQKPQQVIDAISSFYAHDYATVHRGVYDQSEQATMGYEAVREQVAQFIVAKPEEIVFTSGATGGINFIADSWARNYLKAGDEIVITIAEHHANFLPWQRIAQITGAVLRVILIDPDTYQVIIPDNLINERTKLVAVTHTSNVIGNIWGQDYQLLKNLITKARGFGARILLDAAQTIGHRPFSIPDLNPDFVVFSAHKMLGPSGLGILYINQALHDHVEPYQVGGSMVYSAGLEQSRYKVAPHKFEAGTPPIASVIGFGAALDYYHEHIDFAALACHEHELMFYLLKELATVPGITIIGNGDSLVEGHLVSFVHDHVHAHDIASYLNLRTIAVRAGHHCAQPLATFLGIDSSVRVSVHLYNTRSDIANFITALNETLRTLGNR